MKVSNVHQRAFDATPELLAELVADFDTIWPKHMGSPPRPEGELLRIGQMRWREYARPGAVRAWRVVSPPELQGEHWFETERVDDRTVLRHIVDAEVADELYDPIWRHGIEPGHDLLQEAILDNVGRLVAERR